MRADEFLFSLHTIHMRWRAVRRFAEIILPFATVFFLFAAAFGMMHIGVHGHMDQCPFMGMVAICDMTLLQHINAWQQMYTAIVMQATFAALLYAVFAFLALYALFRIRPSTPRVISISYARRGIDQPAFRNPLLYALSNGILHSKAF